MRVNSRRKSTDSMMAQIGRPRAHIRRLEDIDNQRQRQRVAQRLRLHRVHAWVAAGFHCAASRGLYLAAKLRSLALI